MEIFKDTLIKNEEKLFDEQNASFFVNYKFKRKITSMRLTTLNLIINIGFIRGPRFI